MKCKGLIFFSCTLIGCASLPKGDLSSAVDRRAPLKAEEMRGEWPKEDWWEMFDDPILSRMITVAFSNSPSLKAAENKVTEMLQIAREKYAFLLPEFDLNGSLFYQHLNRNGIDRFPPSRVPPVINQVDLNLSFKYEVDFWGKNRKTFKAALSRAKSQELDTAQTKIMLAVSVARAYFDLQYQVQKKENYLDQLAAKRQLLSLTKSRYENDIIDLTALSISEEDLLTLEKQVVKAQNGIEVSKHLLGVLLGLGPEEELEVELRSKKLHKSFPMPGNLSIELLARRADLRARLWSVESAAFEIGVAKTLFYPNVDLTAFGGIQALEFSKLMSPGSLIAGLRPAFTLPLFTGGRLRANLRAKGAAFQALVNQYNELILQAAKEVADGVSNLRLFSDQTELQISILEQMKVQQGLSMARFENGIENLLSLINVTEQVLVQELISLDLEYSKRLAVIDLIRALGGGYDDPKPKDLGEYKRYG